MRRERSNSMSEFLLSFFQGIAFFAFLAVVFGGPGLLWMHILWRDDRKHGRKWGR